MANANRPSAFRPTPMLHGAIVARPEDLLQQARRDDERRNDHGQCQNARRADRPELPVIGVGLHEREAAPAAGRGKRQWQRDGETDQLDAELHHIDPRGGQQPARREIHRDRRAADGTADPRRRPGDGADDRPHRPELTREDEQRPQPEDAGGQRADGSAVTVLEIVADRAELVRGGLPSHRGTNPEGEHDGPDGRRTDPPPRRDAVRVAERGRPDGRSGADVRGEHRRKQQPGAETPARNEKVAGTPHAASDPQTERHQHERVAEQNDEVEVHFRSRTAGIPATPVAWRAARTMASAMTSAASAPTWPASEPAAPVASVKMTSPSPGVCEGASARA